MKIAVGLSGGVDSTIAGYLLKKNGHEVIGLTMKIWDENRSSTNKRSACFSPDEANDIDEIRVITNKLGIPFYTVDLSKEYKDNILSYFKEEYMNGRTPNPCVRCNQMMKFDFLIRKARESNIDFDLFATGHYAKVEYDESRSRYLLKKGIDRSKDQSYFLTLLSQEQLSKVIFPLGDYTKENVKKMARDLNLGVHNKEESQDFYSGDYTELIDNLPAKGEIVTKEGEMLGMHRGICFYTIGQRKGLGISYKHPLYVIGINRKENTVIVGPEKDLYKDKLTVINMNWIAIEKPSKRLRVKARIRYLHKEDDACIIPLEENTVRVIFERPQRAISPGQFAVFYNDNMVIGGGIIDTVE